MHNLTLAQLAAALHAKQFSSLELPRHFLARIKQHDGALNSFITVTEEQALAAARGAEDCALLLAAMSGFDERDSTSVDRPVPNYAATLNGDIAGLKIGLPKEYFGEGLDPHVAAAIEAAIAEYK